VHYNILFSLDTKVSGSMYMVLPSKDISKVAIAFVQKYSFSWHTCSLSKKPRAFARGFG